MPLRERERFVKLSDCELDDCEPGEYGWLSAWETESGGVIFEMTTDVQDTVNAIMDWTQENEKKLGQIYLESDGKMFTLMRDNKQLSFDEAMEVINNFR